MIIRLTCLKLRIRQENFKSVFARVSMARDRAYFASLKIDKSCSLTLTPLEKICATGGDVTSRDQGRYSNDQGRKRRETLGTRLSQLIGRDWEAI